MIYFFAILSLLKIICALNVLPSGFTYLRKVDESIIQEMRYYTFHNFKGQPIRGYYANECILTIEAANALSKVQNELLSQGFTLKVYDCYRPQKAVDDFYNWSQDFSDQRMKKEFYSDLEKDTLFELGYIAKKSGHCRGSTVDLTIVQLPPAPQQIYVPGMPLDPCFAPYEERFRDNSIDMGTGFDCFNTFANTDDPRIIGIPKKNRAFLKELMESQNFRNLDLEWWHFTLNNEPFKDQYFDFDIVPEGDIVLEGAEEL